MIGVTVFSKNGCDYCTRAKAILDGKGVTYTELNVEEDADAKQYLVDAGLRSVPQIYVGDNVIPGGYVALRNLEEDFWTELKENLAKGVVDGE